MEFNEYLALVVSRMFWTEAPRTMTPEEAAIMAQGPLNTEWSVYCAAHEIKAQRIDKNLPMETAGGVALIKIRGVMMKNAPMYSSYVTSSFSVSEAFNVAAKDDKIKAVILSIDSPGGTVGHIVELSDSIYNTRIRKPVIAHVEGMAASAGYWAASQASAIYLGRMDAVGSIGVYKVVEDTTKMAEDMGVKVHLITTGEYKGVEVPGMPITEPQLNEMRKFVGAIFEEFKSSIVRGRGMDRGALDKISDGRAFIGKEAVALGLADGVQTFQQTMTQVFEMVRQQKSDRLRISARSQLVGAELDIATQSLGEIEINTEGTDPR